MQTEFIECQLSSQMEDIESLFFDEYEVALFTKNKPIAGANNEDSIGVFNLAGNNLVVAVADGMGGHKGASQASNIIIKTLAEHLQGFSGSEFDLRGSILDAIELAQLKIRDLRINAGTTLTMASLCPEGLRIYNIGDSAAFHLGAAGQVKYRSFEHSVGGMQLLMGQIGEEEVGTQEQHHQLINYLGYEQMKVEMSGLRTWLKGDKLLLGSDGLFDNVSYAGVFGQLTKDLETDQLLQLVVDAVNENMKHGLYRKAKPDDLSAILVADGSSEKEYDENTE